MIGKKGDMHDVIKRCGNVFFVNLCFINIF